MQPKRLAAITALLGGTTYEQAAKEANVTDRTLYKWLKEPAFKDALRKAESEALDAAGLRLVGMANTALSALEDVLAEPSKCGQNVKRLAARDILDLSLRWHELRSFEKRLSDLEEALNVNKK